MSISTNQNGNHQLESGEILFQEGQTCTSVNIITNGVVELYLSIDENVPDESNIISSSIKIGNLEKSSFLGITSLLSENPYLFTYLSKNNSSVYTYNLHNLEQVKAFFEKNNAYIVFTLDTLCSVISSLNSTFECISEITTNLKIINDNLATIFWHFKSTNTINREPKSKIFIKSKDNFENISEPMPDSFTNQYAEKDHSTWFNTSYNSSVQIENIEYITFFKEFSEQPLDMRKSFLTSNMKMSTSFAFMASSVILDISKKVKLLMNDLVHSLNELYGNDIGSIFTEYTVSAITLRKESKANTDFLLASQFIVEKLTAIDALFKEKFKYSFDMDLEYINIILNEVKGVKAPVNKNTNTEETEDIVVIEGYENLPNEVKNSVKRIIEYSDIPKERADMFLHALKEFRKSKDRFSTNDDMRKVRKGLTTVFFEIYKEVALKVIKEKNNERLYEMFLNYSYMDEQLLDTDQTIMLYKLKDTSKQHDKIKVYNLKEWLTLIHEEKQSPSVNGFGQTYKEALREMKKRGMINEDEMTALLESPDNKVKYEVENMLANTQRLCYGQVSLYSPVLHKDMIISDMQNAFLSRERIVESVENLLDVDFSAFYREILYKNPEEGVEKEIIMSEVAPIFILIPTYGNRSIMWQELDGYNKNSEGRILFPIISSTGLNDLMNKSVGALRWELCRNILGISWNDITQSSLTSNYNDYVQFYKKNRNISEETRAKVKIQAQKNRGNLKEFFIDDYQIWVKYESKGIIRLNKVARNILYRFCPFSKKIRDELANQPLFSDITNKFKNIRRREFTNIEHKFHRYTKTGKELPKILKDYLAFYKDM